MKFHIHGDQLIPAKVVNNNHREICSLYRTRYLFIATKTDKTRFPFVKQTEPASWQANAH